jgi:hypothetical protein
MLPKIEDSMESWSAPPTYIGEKGRTLGKNPPHPSPPKIAKKLRTKYI